ncbi:MAG TPA: hypothetical protein VN458_00165 [Solirubrobacterales bacterium]|nr:hypothetical protein [Solirubrobacterales bacterium]
MGSRQTIPDRLELSSLGPTPQAALRRLVDEFERRGWRDDGTGALAVVRVLEGGGGSAPWSEAAKAVPRVFLSHNHARRRDLEEALRSAAGKR